MTGMNDASIDPADPDAPDTFEADDDAPAPDGAVERKRKSIQSVETGIRVLNALADARRSLRLRDLALLSEMSKSQAHRYLLAFVNTGLVRQDAASGLYELGPMALRIGLAALSRVDAVNEATVELRKLVDATGHTGILSIWGDFGPTIIRWMDGSHPVVVSLNVGSILPVLNTAAGLVFCAFGSPTKVEPLMMREAATAGQPYETIQQRIAEVRASGYATTQGMMVPSLAAIAAPVRDTQGLCIATIALSASLSNRHFLDPELIDQVRAAAANASSAVGWNPAIGDS